MNDLNSKNDVMEAFGINHEKIEEDAEILFTSREKNEYAQEVFILYYSLTGDSYYTLYYVEAVGDTTNTGLYGKWEPIPTYKDELLNRIKHGWLGRSCLPGKWDKDIFATKLEHFLLEKK